MVGNREAGTKGWLGDWDPDNEDAMLPLHVDKAAEQFANWVRQQTGWYSGSWVDHRILCLWHAYQEVGLVSKARRRGKVRSS